MSDIIFPNFYSYRKFLRVHELVVTRALRNRKRNFPFLKRGSRYVDESITLVFALDTSGFLRARSTCTTSVRTIGMLVSNY